MFLKTERGLKPEQCLLYNSNTFLNASLPLFTQHKPLKRFYGAKTAHVSSDESGVGLRSSESSKS